MAGDESRFAWESGDVTIVPGKRKKKARKQPKPKQDEGQREPDGDRLYREFKEAEKADERVTAARRRIRRDDEDGEQ